MTPKNKKKKDKQDRHGKTDLNTHETVDLNQEELQADSVHPDDKMTLQPLNDDKNIDSGELATLIKQKENYYIKKEYLDAIIIAEEIIKVARKEKNKDVVQEQEKFIANVHKEMKKKYANANVEEIISDLDKLKEEHEFNFKFEDAIAVARKIIHIAFVAKKKDVIVQKEDYIKSIKQKLNQKPSKLELVEKIEQLKGIKQEHVVKGEESEAVQIAKQIIEIAKIASIDSVIAEEEKYIKSIKELHDKEILVSTAIDELRNQKTDYEILVKYNAIKEAHQMIEDFSLKYEEFPEIFTDSYVKEFITEDKKNWVKYSVAGEQTKKEGEFSEIGRKKIVKLELDKVRLEEEKSRLRRDLAKLKRQQEYSDMGKLKLELDQKNAKLEIYKKRLESDKQRLENRKEKEMDGIEKEQQEMELEKARLEEEKTRVKLEALKLEKLRFADGDDKTTVQLEKTELEEERQRLTTEVTRFMEEKEDFQKDRSDFEEEVEQKKKEWDAKASELEKLKIDLESEIEEEREKLEWDKLKLEEEKKQLEQDKQKFEEIKQKLMDL